jgi:hypothetical protein
MYHAELIYGIRIRIPNPKYVDEVLLQEYRLRLAYNEIVTLTQNGFVGCGGTCTIYLPCERSELHSLSVFVQEDWDDRLHRYAADAGMVDYSIGWHVYLPETKPKTNLNNDSYENLTLDPSKVDWTRTTTGRFDTSKPNISNPPKTSYTKPTITIEEQERLLDEFLAAEEKSSSTLQEVPIKTVPIPEIPDRRSFALPTPSPKETLHSTTFGDLIDHGDGTWTCMYWRRGGSKLAAPLKLTVDVNLYGQPLVVSKHPSIKFVLEEGSIVEGLKKELNKMFSDYREIRRGEYEAEPQSRYESVLLALIDDDIISSTSNGKTKTYKFDNGSIQHGPGERWFIMNWKQDGLELIKPLKVEVDYMMSGSLTARWGRYEETTKTGNLQSAVADLARQMFNRYAELMSPRGDDSERDAADREFLSSKIRLLPIEEVALNDAVKRMTKKLEDELVLHLNGPGVDPNRFAIEGRISAEDLVAQAKAYLEKKLDE